LSPVFPVFPVLLFPSRRSRPSRPSSGTPDAWSLFIPRPCCATW
jgi:hypothetical protein